MAAWEAIAAAAADVAAGADVADGDGAMHLQQQRCPTEIAKTPRGTGHSLSWHRTSPGAAWHSASRVLAA